VARSFASYRGVLRDRARRARQGHRLRATRARLHSLRATPSRRETTRVR